MVVGLLILDPFPLPFLNGRLNLGPEHIGGSGAWVSFLAEPLMYAAWGVSSLFLYKEVFHAMGKDNGIGPGNSSGVSGSIIN